MGKQGGRRRMGKIPLKQGSIYLVPFPFSNFSNRKVRPIVIISKEEFNKGEDIIACAITSNINKEGIIIDSSSLEKGVLYNPSCIKPFALHSLEKSMLLKEIGVLNKETIQEVKKEVKKLF